MTGYPLESHMKFASLEPANQLFSLQFFQKQSLLPIQPAALRPFCSNSPSDEYGILPSTLQEALHPLPHAAAFNRACNDPIENVSSTAEGNASTSSRLGGVGMLCREFQLSKQYVLQDHILSGYMKTDKIHVCKGIFKIADTKKEIY